MTRDAFSASLRRIATYRPPDSSSKGVRLPALTEDQFTAILAAADQYAAHIAEQVSRPPDKLDRRAS
jgi:hypothetical protein